MSRKRAWNLVAALLLVLAVLNSSQSPVSPNGTVSFPFGTAWQVSGDSGHHTLTGDTVLTVSRENASGVNAGTGVLQWRFRPPPGFVIVSWATTNDSVVLSMDTNPGPGYRWATVGLDPSTGARLWDEIQPQLIPSPEYFLHGGPPDRLASGAGMVIVPWRIPHLGIIIGIDARTGHIAWFQFLNRLKIGHVSHCDVLPGGESLVDIRPLVAADDQVAAVAAQCQEGQAVLGFNPRTGAPLWAVPVPLPAGTVAGQLLVRDRAILMAWSGHGVIIDTSGRVIYQGSAPGEELAVVVTGGIIVISGSDGGGHDLLTSLDLRTGQTLWSQSRTSPYPPNWISRNAYLSLATAGGAVLGYRSAAGRDLLPAVIDRIDPVTGAAQSTAIPVVGSGWITTFHDLLLLHSDDKLTAFPLTTSGTLPSENDSAPDDQWPDACALLRPERIQDVRPQSLLKIVRNFSHVAGHPLHNPTVCRFNDLQSGIGNDPRSTSDELSGSEVFRVTVTWVARDQRSAATLADDARANKPLLPATGIWAFGDPVREVTARVGAVIVQVSSADLTVPAIELTRLVRQRLDALGCETKCRPTAASAHSPACGVTVDSPHQSTEAPVSIMGEARIMCDHATDQVTVAAHIEIGDERWGGGLNGAILDTIASTDAKHEYVRQTVTGCVPGTFRTAARIVTENDNDFGDESPWNYSQPVTISCRYTHGNMTTVPVEVCPAMQNNAGTEPNVPVPPRLSYPAIIPLPAYAQVYGAGVPADATSDNKPEVAYIVGPASTPCTTQAADRPVKGRAGAGLSVQTEIQVGRFGANDTANDATAILYTPSTEGDLSAVCDSDNPRKLRVIERLLGRSACPTTPPHNPEDTVLDIPTGKEDLFITAGRYPHMFGEPNTTGYQLTTVRIDEAHKSADIQYINCDVPAGQDSLCAASMAIFLLYDSRVTRQMNKTQLDTATSELLTYVK